MRPKIEQTECRNGHDLTLPGAVYTRVAGQRECKRCRRNGVRRLRRKRRKLGIPADRPNRHRGPSERQMSAGEVEAHFARMRFEENHARPWEKSKRMWDEPDHKRMR